MNKNRLLMLIFPACLLVFLFSCAKPANDPNDTLSNTDNTIWSLTTIDEYPQITDDWTSESVTEPPVTDSQTQLITETQYTEVTQKVPDTQSNPEIRNPEETYKAPETQKETSPAETEIKLNMVIGHIDNGGVCIGKEATFILEYPMMKDLPSQFIVSVQDSSIISATCDAKGTVYAIDPTNNTGTMRRNVTVKGLKTGESNLDIRTPGGQLIAQAHIIVRPVKIFVPNEIKFSTFECQGIRPYSMDYGNLNYTFTISDTSIININDNIIMPKKIGTTTVLVSAYDGSGNKVAEETTTVIITEPSGVYFDQQKSPYKVGTTACIKATVYPSTLSDRSITYTSFTPSIATIDQSGTITFHRAGNAIIEAKSNQTGEKALIGIIVID